MGTSRETVEFIGIDKLSSVTKKVNSAVSQLGAILATGVLAQGMKALISSAAEAEKVNNQLAAAVKRTGGSYTEYNALLEQSVKLQRQSVVNDEEIKTAQATLLTITKDYNAALAGTNAAMDMAAAMGMSLEQASVLVGRAFNGNVEMLNRYGIQLQKGVTGMEALRAISQRFYGAAQAQTLTLDGQLKQLNNSWDDVKESLGTLLLPVIKDLTGNANELAIALGSFGGSELQNGIYKTYLIFKLLIDMVGTSIAGVMGHINIMTQSFKNPIELVKALGDNFKNTFEVAGGVFDTFMTKFNAGAPQTINALNNTALAINTQTVALENTAAAAKKASDAEAKLKAENQDLANTMISTAQLVGDSMAGIATGAVGAWQNLAIGIVDTFIGAMQKVLAAQLIVNGIINWAAVPGTLAAIAALSALGAGVKAAIGSTIPTTATEETATAATSGSETGGSTSSPTTATPLASSSGSNVLNIYVQNPTFFSSSDFSKTIDEMMGVAQDNGWNINKIQFNIA